MSDPSKSDKDPKSTAYHEAGHVFMHELFGKDYDYVSIQNPEEAAVHYSYSDPSAGKPITTGQLIYVCICFAGHVTEDRLNFAPTEPRENIGVNMLDGFGIPGSDYEKYKALHLPLGSLNPLLDFTVDVILANWPTVSSIGDALYQKKFLSAEDVKTLIGDEDFAASSKDYIEQLNKIGEILEKE